MHSLDSSDSSSSAPKLTTEKSGLTSYQVAVLATLFEQTDQSKVVDLARQWGCEQELVDSAWYELHGIEPKN